METSQSAAVESAPHSSTTLSEERVLELWSQTYNDQGKPDWSHILPYYDEQIVFQDTIQRIEGKAEFTALCRRLTDRCQKLIMHIKSIARNGSVIFFEWEMVMVFRNSPSTSLYGTTKLTLNADEKIVEQRDYYDLWGDIFNNIPGWRRIYRKALVRFFG